MRCALGVVLVFLVLCAPATAAPRTETVRYGPIALSPYGVARGDQVFNVPKPAVDGYITAMSARLVYADGREVPIANTMLHHVVFADLGTYIGDHRDSTCERLEMFDSESFLPLHGFRFYGLGEERARLSLPPGYGYPTQADDRWAFTYMLMNHVARAESVYLEYTMKIETERELQPVTPVWLDVRDCSLDPVFDVPGGGRPGSKYKTSTIWTAPTGGKLVFAAGHMHGGGRSLALSRADCGERTVFRSRPLWGRRSHPYYRVRPLLHEPGPISMSAVETAQGIPVAAGERIRLTAVYDNERPHTRAMGIMIAAFVPDPSITTRCGAQPADARTVWTERVGRRKMPRVTVPLTARPRGGRAREITRPPGRTVSMRTGDIVDVSGLSFNPSNTSLRAGAELRWRFFERDLHNVTLANGPRGFSSKNLSRGREFRYRFRKPGTYRLFCTLHPVDMAATVRVRPR